MNTNTPCRHCGERYHGHDLFAGQHPYEPSPNLHKTPDTYTPPEQTYTPDKLPTAAEMLQAANESSAVQQKIIDEYNELDTILQELSDAAWSLGLQGAKLHELKNSSQNRMTVADTRALVLQYIEGIIGEDEQNQELDNYGEVWTEARNAFKAEQRQKLRGENG